MEFVIIGKLNKSTEEITNIVKKLGGKIVNEIHSNLAAVISSLKEIIKNSDPRIIEAKQFGIQVVSEDFLTQAQVTDPIAYITNKCISLWGGDVSFMQHSLRFLKHIHTTSSKYYI